MISFRSPLLFLLVLSSTWLSAAGSKPKKPDPEALARKAEAIQLYNTGTAQLKDLNFSEAETTLKAALEKDSKLAEAHNNLAFALRKQGEDRYEEALKHYNRAVRIDRKLAEAYMYRGVLYTAMGDVKKAQKDLKRLTKLSPELAVELEWVIEHGTEKEPAQFFGVSHALE